MFFFLILVAGALFVSYQVLGSVKTTQSKEYKKLKQQLNQSNHPDKQRRVSFDSDEDSSETLQEEKLSSTQDFNQEIDHQTLQQMIKEKLDSAQNSETRNNETVRNKKMKDIAARMETKSTKSYIS